MFSRRCRLFNDLLDEFEWRFNNRKNPFLFRYHTLKLIHSDSLELTRN